MKGNDARDSRMARVARIPGEDLIKVYTPTQADDGFSLGSSTSLVQVITDDKPFLVEFIVEAIEAQGWTVREVYHPIVHVARDDQGTVTGHGDIAEAWIQIEVYPPLGVASDTVTHQLDDAVHKAVVDVDVATKDAAAMRESMLGTASHVPDDYASLLSWLADRVTFLGAQEMTSADGRGDDRVEGTGLGILRNDKTSGFHGPATMESDEPVRVIPDSETSKMYKHQNRDLIIVNTGEGTQWRFIVLLNPSAYSEPVSRIPVLQTKAKAVADRLGYVKNSHSWRQLQTILNAYPRSELFWLPVDELADTAEQIIDIQARRTTRVFMHKDPWGRFVAIQVFMPREKYDSTAQGRIQDVLTSTFSGEILAFRALVSEAALTRLYFRVSTPEAKNVDASSLEEKVVAAAQGWDDRFIDLVSDLPSEQRGIEFTDEYRAHFTPEQGASHLNDINTLPQSDGLILHLEATTTARMDIISTRQIVLADLLPHLANLGVRVTEEHPFHVTVRGSDIMIYEVTFPCPVEDWDENAQQQFLDSFRASFTRVAESDTLGRLCLRGISWTEIVWLRAMVKYLVQAGIPYSPGYIASSIVDNPDVAKAWVEAFRGIHDPCSATPVAEPWTEDLASMLDQVTSLDHDRILRSLIELLGAIVRTNAFVYDPASEGFAIKLLPERLSFLPKPHPVFEIWVYSPRVEGVHLRFGRVARGGIRWSDRPEDFRTEVLGLVKAQMVKNCVIVPVGAKGGFYPKQLPSVADKAAWLKEGTEAYEIFVSALLSLTDNVVAGDPVPPPGVRCLDDPDPYLVVAADKGTASFSDLANSIAERKGFWIGDAFASGGSHGYDHKAMGITARGAWESTRRHFHELGIDPDADDFTVIGIGDMSGDVFGNGMLLSRHIKLVAAFDHRHIVIDPDPDPETTWVERERLFHLPQSSWADFDKTLLSAGGGVFPRTAKWIQVSSQARTALGLDKAKFTPTELIHALLKSPVDLLWNGGIGTYVKGTTQSNAEVGDKANDSTRVNGAEVGARCAVEGGNLGWTQAGRVEYAQAGGKINTDFIDNSAGVDTSDHEVNIKILLADAMADGRLTMDERNSLLESMTDSIASLVLAHNTDQNLALADADLTASRNAGEHEDWIEALEKDGYIDRQIESLPTHEQMAARIAAGKGLTNPELATLLSWTKIRLTDLVLLGDLPEDPYLQDRLITYFPLVLRERYADLMPTHRLHREIIATVAVNRFVHSQGITAYHRLHVETGASVADVIRAQLAARAIFSVGGLETTIRKADIPADVKARLRRAIMNMVDRTARWLLHRCPSIDIADTIDMYKHDVGVLLDECLPQCLAPMSRASYDATCAQWQSQGVDGDIAAMIAQSGFIHLLPMIVSISSSIGLDLPDTATGFFRVREDFAIPELASAISNLPRDDEWMILARAALRDDLLSVQESLTTSILDHHRSYDEALTAFAAGHTQMSLVVTTVKELSATQPDLARLTVALRTLRQIDGEQ